MPRVSASVHYSPDFYLEAGDAVYVDGTVGMSLPYGFGYQTVDAVDIADLDVDGGQRELPRLARRDIEGGCWDSGWTSAIGDAENEEVFCGLGSQNCRGTAGGRYPGDFEGLAAFLLPAHAPPKRSICGVALIGGMNCPVSKAW
jgi:hypothetical protein